jgi:hypothetical protein
MNFALQGFQAVRVKSSFAERCVFAESFNACQYPFRCMRFNCGDAADAFEMGKEDIKIKCPIADRQVGI